MTAIIRWLVSGSPWIIPGNIPLSVGLELGSLVILVTLTPILAWFVYRSEQDWLISTFELLVFSSFACTLFSGPFVAMMTLISMTVAGLGLITVFLSVFCTVRTAGRLINGVSTFAGAIKQAANQASVAANTPPTDL